MSLTQSILLDGKQSSISSWIQNQSIKIVQFVIIFYLMSSKESLLSVDFDTSYVTSKDSKNIYEKQKYFFVE